MPDGYAGFWSIVAAIFAGIAVIIAAGIAAWATRKGAKDSQERTDRQTAGELWSRLTNEQRTDLTDVRSRLTAAENALVEVRQLLNRRDQLARMHVGWDDELIALINDAIPGAHIRPAPPLTDD